MNFSQTLPPTALPIPEYPIFRPIELCDKEFFDAAFQADAPELSEYTFTNLYAWRNIYRFTVSLRDRFLLLRSQRGPEISYLCPVGKEDKRVICEKILSEEHAGIIRVPREVKELISGLKFVKAVPDRDNADYLYNTEDLVFLKGRKYDAKRNLIKKFKSQYAYTYEPCAHPLAEECVQFQKAWCEVKKCDATESLRQEGEAVQEVLDKFYFLNLRAGIIRIQGEIRAFAIGEPLNRDTLVVHILKADSSLSGLYQTMLQEFIVQEARSFSYVNLEQDLGFEGLRKAKLSYHPARLCEKFILREEH